MSDFEVYVNNVFKNFCGAFNCLGWVFWGEYSVTFKFRLFKSANYSLGGGGGDAQRLLNLNLKSGRCVSISIVANYGNDKIFSGVYREVTYDGLDGDTLFDSRAIVDKDTYSRFGKNAWVATFADMLSVAVVEYMTVAIEKYFDGNK